MSVGRAVQFSDSAGSASVISADVSKPTDVGRRDRCCRRARPKRLYTGAELPVPTGVRLKPAAFEQHRLLQTQPKPSHKGVDGLDLNAGRNPAALVDPRSLA